MTLFDLINPPGREWNADVSLPTVGKTPQALHASATGAQEAAKTRGALSVAYLNLLTVAGPRGMSDQEAADALGRRLSSICSTRNSLGSLVIASGSYEETEFNTKRTRFTRSSEPE